ncbi:MAG: leucine--tRNA ligase [Chlamydiota bacterium]
MTQKYDPSAIEPKWQQYWLQKKTFKADIDDSKPKYYLLDMFPYPSGSGLHMGHVLQYTATDILGRYMLKKGYNVLHPMGWDSFGLPAERYAMRTGTHPAITTKNNIDNFRHQLQSLGFAYDWDREIATSDPKYYKWTQWIFTKLYERGLAYEAEMMVNYCPALGTVVANEEVQDGVYIDTGDPIERRPLKQWVLKITEYAQRLIDDLEFIDWPEGLKKAQANWIGRSEGAKVDFAEDSTGEIITVFTTRPDTLFGATYMVLSPEHPLVDKIITEDCMHAVEDYRQEAASKSDLQRTELSQHKTGVFTGAYAVNPVNGKRIPIWISDYVLIGYGTGAIMAVPCHDERDFQFALKFNLPILPVFDPDTEGYPELVPEDVDPQLLRQKVLQGKICWTGEGVCINSANDEISLNGLPVAEAKRTIIEWLEKKGFGEKNVSYKLRDWLFSRQRYWGEPFPVLHLEDGSRRVLDADELPLMPPDLTDFKPCGDGSSPLAKAKEWLEIVDPKTGKKALRETNTMPQWAGSCWYYLRYIDPHNDDEAWSPEAENYWMPVDQYVGGAEHAVLHLLYARFWHKVLYDCGLVSTPEPFKRLRNQGIISAYSYQKNTGAYVAPKDVEERDGYFYHKETGEKVRRQVEKMSKSKLNGVDPEEVIKDWGVDALRMLVMFMGPLEKAKIWNSDPIQGCRRFLDKFYDAINSDKVSDTNSEEALKLAHKLLDGVSRDIEGLLFNTAIAKLMEFINQLTKLPSYPREVLEIACHCLAPIAPHIAEEAWCLLGNTSDLALAPIPRVEEKYLREDTVVYIVQVNGKLRGRLELPKDQSQQQIYDAAVKDSRVHQHLAGREPRKIIFIPNKLLNIVV